MPGTTGWSTNVAGLPAFLWDALGQAGYTTNNGTVTITRYTGPDTSWIIPSTINGLPVTSIGSFLNTSLTNVTIPSTVTNVAGGAFSGWYSLTTIKVDAPNSVYSSVDGVLFDKSQTTLVEYPCGLDDGSYAIPNSVTSIGDEAFEGCESLTSITIPNSVTSIGDYGFSWCTSLTNVTIGTSVSTIGDNVFYLCTSLTSVTIGNGVTSIGDSAFFGCQLTSVTIGTNVTSIGDSAFYGCGFLTSVTIPNSVTSIGDYAFYSTRLTNVTIPNSVTYIGDHTFGGCNGLTAITVDTRNPNYSDVDGVLFNKSQTTLIQYPLGRTGTFYTIPNSVISIGDNAFQGCGSLTSVTIGTSVSTIGDNAFYACTSLTSVTIGNGVTSIGDEAFEGCESLTSITIPNSVTSIGDYGFSWCTSLTNVTIGTSVTNIGSLAFESCYSLTAVFFQGNAPSPSDDLLVFSSDNNPTVYYLPGTTGWSSTFDGRPTALWLLPNPLILNNGPSFGVKTNLFGFIISWATNIPVVVEACTSLLTPTWSPISTNTLNGGSAYFSDPEWKNYPSRFYRLRWP